MANADRRGDALILQRACEGFNLPGTTASIKYCGVPRGSLDQHRDTLCEFLLLVFEVGLQVHVDKQAADGRELRRVGRETGGVLGRDANGGDADIAVEAQMKMLDSDFMTEASSGIGLGERNEPVPGSEEYQEQQDDLPWTGKGRRYTIIRFKICADCVQ